MGTFYKPKVQIAEISDPVTPENRDEIMAWIQGPSVDLPYNEDAGYAFTITDDDCGYDPDYVEYGDRVIREGYRWYPQTPAYVESHYDLLFEADRG